MLIRIKLRHTINNSALQLTFYQWLDNEVWKTYWVGGTGDFLFICVLVFLYLLWTVCKGFVCSFFIIVCFAAFSLTWTKSNISFFSKCHSSFLNKFLKVLSIECFTTLFCQYLHSWSVSFWLSYCCWVCTLL